jgi:quinol monooxygenase YgiN
MNKYGFFGKFTAHHGKREELINILLQAAQLISTAKGCIQYVVCKDSKNENLVCVTEIWDSKEDHDLSLKIDGCMALISKAMPLLDGRPETNELEVVGGKGH